MSITLTPSAASKLGELLQEENNPQTKLRIFGSGGGCPGSKEGHTSDDQP
ncbi:MAG: iron-sulfur cluster insertion protein ErpA, partial [Magnetococcales bacterium]|nr:iron-sulfur cluster insertion protein ErpA [Magnetococcales bacterium]